MKKNRIAFVSTYSHLTNENFYNLLKATFNDHKVDMLTLSDLVLINKLFKFINLIYTFIEYGFEIILGRKKLRECFFRTTYIFKKVKKVIAKRINDGGYSFSIQSASLYDTSTGSIPHFIYTDHTHLENLRYPAYKKKNLFFGSWLERERSIYHNATMNFTFSTNVQRSIINDYDCPPEKVKCIYAGSNVPQDHNPTLNNDNYQNKNIIFVGVYWERKGGPDLIKAFERVREIHPDATLTIIGSLPKISIPNCNVLGKIKVEDLGKYYLESSIFCLPTKREPFGIVFIEAMMHKLPIVSNRIGALPDFVTDNENGFLVDAGDIEGLANVLIKLLDNPEMCKEFGEKGYLKVADTYTWGKVGERLRENILPFLD